MSPVITAFVIVVAELVDLDGQGQLRRVLNVHLVIGEHEVDHVEEVEAAVHRQLTDNPGDELLIGDWVAKALLRDVAMTLRNSWSRRMRARSL